MFADDTICYAQGSTTEEVQSYLHIDVHNANIWYNDNKLNIDKLGCMLLGTRERVLNNSNIEIVKFYKCMSALLI